MLSSDNDFISTKRLINGLEFILLIYQMNIYENAISQTERTLLMKLVLIVIYGKLKYEQVWPLLCSKIHVN